MNLKSHENLDRKVIIAISSGGGHWVQLLRLKPVLDLYETTYITVSKNYNQDLNGERFKRIIDATANRMGVTEDKVMMNIEKYGNTTSGTLPLLLWDYESRLKKGDNLIIAAFGGGFTWGSIYLKWAYDSK